MKSVRYLCSTAVLIAAASVHTASLASDPLAPRPNGMAVDRPSKHLITGATIHLSPTQTYDADSNPGILIEDGVIIGVVESTNTIRLKPGFQVHELPETYHIYAGFIDPFVEVDTQAIDPNSSGKHWNRFVTPQRDALIGPGLTTKQAESLRKHGFTTAMIAPDSGVFRGWTATVSTADHFNDPSLGLPPVHQSHAGQMMGYDRTNWSDADYPTSHMGVISLMRQTFLDAEHYHKSKATNPSCLSQVTPDDTTFFYDTSTELEAVLADKIATEFDHDNIVIIGSGSEHRRLDALVEMDHPIVVPMTFPEEPEVWTINDADNVSLAALQHWERAPANARWLHNAGLTVALTSSKLRDGEKFYDNLHEAIKRGLPASDALAMLTTNAADILDLDNQGEIKNGYLANLVVASDDLFDPESKAQIIDTWIDGRKHHINDDKPTHFDGYWEISVVGAPFTMWIDIEGDSITAYEGEGDDLATNKARKVEIEDNAISFILDDDDDGSGSYIMSGTLLKDGSMRGTGLGADQNPFNWTAKITDAPITMETFQGTWDATLAERFNLTFKVGKDSVTIVEHVEDADDITQESTTAEIQGSTLAFTFEHEPFGIPGTFSIALSRPSDDDTLIGIGMRPDNAPFQLTATKAEEDKKDDKSTETLPDAPPSPFGPYAMSEIPPQESIVILNATIWTQSDAGIIENGAIEIRKGKIVRVWKDADYNQDGGPAITVIDGTGLHVTPGLIDAHSHTGLFRFGVNESGQAVTSECRIEDSLDPGYIGFYRELAGGLTSAQLLHGSANPIGGQSKTIKLRWGMNRPEDMYFEDAKPGIKFALGENVKQSNWGDDKTTRYPQTRMGVETTMRDRFTKAREYAERGMKTASGDTDLELEALAEILAGERLVHCHSYRQDEILMLCRIAEEFGFKIGTFQHGLETYKVAEIVKEHSIGASIFSDWWAYKVEVTDAIPYAGPINHEVGLLTSFNSDSDDVARRMNVEAAKALKYARASGIAMTEQEALAFVTTNPAIQLDIIDRVGTLEAGKDADIVIWSGSPLSSLSRCESTYIDGRKYFSLEDDAAHREAINNERTRLTQLILTKDHAGSNKKNAKKHDHDHEHDDPDYDIHNHDTRGDCGCNQLMPAYHTDY